MSTLQFEDSLLMFETTHNRDNPADSDITSPVGHRAARILRAMAYLLRLVFAGYHSSALHFPKTLPGFHDGDVVKSSVLLTVSREINMRYITWMGLRASRSSEDKKQVSGTAKSQVGQGRGGSNV